MTTKLDALSETFLPDITDLTKRLRAFLSRYEFRELKAAIKIGDFRWADFAIRKAARRLAAENGDDFHDILDIRDEWVARIRDEGGIDEVIGLVYRASYDGKWNGVQVRRR